MGGTKGNGVERSQSDSKVKTQELFRFIHSPNCCCVCELLSHVKLFVTLWTVASQAPLSMGFSRQEYWSGFCFLLQGIFLTQGTNPGLLHCRQILCPQSYAGFGETKRRQRKFFPLRGADDR